MRRFGISVLAVFLAVSLIAPCAEASRGGKKKRARKAKTAHSFELQSELVAQVPEIAAALAFVESNPQLGSAWQHLGTALANFGDFPDAIAALERGVSVAPDDPAIWTDLGAAEVRRENFRAGIRAFRKALNIEPFYALAHYNLGIAYRESGNWDEAMASFEKALLLEPSLGDPTQNPGAVNNPDLGLVKLRVYLKTSGAAPALFAEERTPEGEKR